MKFFSKRYGYEKLLEKEITIRQDAPFEFRGVLIELAYGCGFRPSLLRKVICRTLKKRPDSNNWSEYPNIDEENHYLVDECEWFKVYDVVESICKKMREKPNVFEYEKFEKELKKFWIKRIMFFQNREKKQLRENYRKPLLIFPDARSQILLGLFSMLWRHWSVSRERVAENGMRRLEEYLIDIRVLYLPRWIRL